MNFCEQQISVRSGGHDSICANLKNNSIHFDLRLLNRVQLADRSKLPYKVRSNQFVFCDNVTLLMKYAQPPGVRLLHLGPGNTWERVLQRVPRSRYTMTHGQCLTVGVGGYLAKSGNNWTGGGNLLGTGASNVVRHTMVTSTGDVFNVDSHGMHRVDLNTGQEVPQDSILSLCC